MNEHVAEDKHYVQKVKQEVGGNVTDNGHDDNATNHGEHYDVCRLYAHANNTNHQTGINW